MIIAIPTLAILNCLVVTGTWMIFPYIGNVIIPIDELIFFRGVENKVFWLNSPHERSVGVAINLVGSVFTHGRACYSRLLPALTAIDFADCLATPTNFWSGDIFDWYSLHRFFLWASYLSESQLQLNNLGSCNRPCGQLLHCVCLFAGIRSLHISFSFWPH